MGNLKRNRIFCAYFSAFGFRALLFYEISAWRNKKKCRRKYGSYERQHREIAKGISEANQNTSKNKEVVSKISSRQDEIHENVKEILRIARDKGK